MVMASHGVMSSAGVRRTRPAAKASRQIPENLGLGFRALVD